MKAINQNLNEMVRNVAEAEPAVEALKKEETDT